VWIPKLYDGRNKTFWFFTVDEDLRPTTPLISTGTVPTAAYKGGDFSASPQVVYDPASTTVAAERTPFPGGIIPKARWSKVSTNIVPLIPDPTRGASTANFDYVGSQVYEDPHWSLKFDHMISSNMRVAYYMSREYQNTGVNSILPGPIGQGLGASTQKPENYRANHDWTITPTSVLHTTFSFTRQQQGWDNPAQKGYGSKIGLPLSGAVDAFPRVMWTNSRDVLTPWGVQDGKVANGGQLNWTFHWSQSLSLIRGKHEYKVGWDLRRLRTFSDPVDLAGSNGQYFFNTLQTGLPGNTNTGHPFASFLLGLVDSANTTSLPVTTAQIRYQYYGGYFMDNWKLTQRLTLNLGMRYEVPVGWHDKDGNFSWVDLKTINPATGGPGALVFAGNGTGRIGKLRPYGADFSNFGPRFGFAYRLFPKTVLRGGFGIYYQTLSNGGCGCRDGFGGPPVTKNSDGVNAALQWDGGIPIPANAGLPPFIDPTFDNGNSVESITPTFYKAPRMREWSFNIQHEVKNFLVDVAYVGNRGTGLNSSVDLNQLPVSRLSLGTLLTQRIDSPAVAAAGFTKPYASFPNNFSLAQSLRPYPQYLLIRGRNTGQGKIWYDSLQLKTERRFGAWQLMGSYVWSKSLSVAHYRQIFSQTQVQAQDYYNYDDMKSFSPFHQPHVVNILSSYDLPIGRGKKFLNVQSRWTDAVIGGWNVSFAARYYTPTLFQVSAPVNDLASYIFAGYKKADRINGQDIRTSAGRGDMDALLNAYLAGGSAAANAQRYFNPAAFGTNATTTGQAPRLGAAAVYYNEFRNPNIYTENIAVSKRFRVPVTQDRTVDIGYRADQLRRPRQHHRQRQLRVADRSHDRRPAHHHGSPAGFLR
jgi:TonB dependent receptor